MRRLPVILFLLSGLLYGDYPDQHRVLRTSEMWSRISSSTNIILGNDAQSLELAEGAVSGSFILLPDTLQQAFNRGLPSWNGHVYTEDSGFKVFIRFKLGDSWSPWLTVGFWKNNIWNSYGTTSYTRGYIDYDYAKLNDYHTIFQWSVQMQRKDSDDPSPSIKKLSFFTSDSRSTGNIDHPSLLADDPPAIFYPTSFVCQYNVDPVIGGSICSPTSTVMVIRSYGISVDPYTFAVDNKDPYFQIFGVWPRTVQNAAAFHLDGAVTRYRSWSQAYDSLAAGGRVVMSVGRPLYAGHLMMLAGFDAQGNPIVHDSAQQNGNAYVFDKASLDSSWFNKGGIGYTFFLDEASLLDIDGFTEEQTPQELALYQNYPNPFNASTSISFFLTEPKDLSLRVYDIQGRFVALLGRGNFTAGTHFIKWNAGDLPSGVYLVRLESGQETLVRRTMLLK